ncbi:hypothetical protein [Psychrobacter sp. I-STPA10]|uniref:hypothetical protein n=1 Tax=Psychrobacter sp. I-STPA10 TaxID=2585769 RepID=UPI001E46267C|nr:hypothetical protein [Psychrobacter sp. I-STPA10]
MSINKQIKVTDQQAAAAAETLNVDSNITKEEATSASIDKSADPKELNETYAGRKYQPDIDGPQQDSQETDEIYSDPRKQENLPPAGKNVGELNAHDLSRNNDV